MRVTAADIPAECALVEVDGTLTVILSDELPPSLVSSLGKLLASVDAKLNIDRNHGHADE